MTLTCPLMIQDGHSFLDPAYRGFCRCGLHQRPIHFCAASICSPLKISEPQALFLRVLHAERRHLGCLGPNHHMDTSAGNHRQWIFRTQSQLIHLGSWFHSKTIGLSGAHILHQWDLLPHLPQAPSFPFGWEYRYWPTEFIQCHHPLYVNSWNMLLGFSMTLYRLGFDTAWGGPSK